MAQAEVWHDSFSLTGRWAGLLSSHVSKWEEAVSSHFFLGPRRVRKHSGRSHSSEL